MAVNWSYYDKKEFEKLNEMYLPISGEGETKANQIVVAVNKLVYKWYNDGDVFDNTHALSGWANDLSDFANWLAEHTEAGQILDKIADCIDDSDYEDLLKELADKLLDGEYLAEQHKLEKVGTVYDCAGKFSFVDYDDDDDEYYDDDDDDYYVK